MNKKHLQCTAACLAWGVLCLLLTGCRSVGARDDLVAPPGGTTAGATAAEASSEAIRNLNVRVAASGAAPADAIRQAVEGRLVSAGYKISSDAPDILVQLASRCSEFDRSGGYLRYEGTAEVGVTRAWDEKRLGFETVSAKGKRGLGEDEAMRNLAAELSEAAGCAAIKFAQSVQSGLAVTDITIKRSWLRTRDPEYAQRVINAARAQKGVVHCALVAHDYETRVLTFRIAYMADAIPEGMLNRLISIRELGIKPRN